MAQVDLNISYAQFNTMMIVLNGIRTKLGSNKDALTRVLSMENGKAKIKAFAAAQDPAWLREVAKMRKDLNQFFEDIGWEAD